MPKVVFQGKRELRWLQEGECFVTCLEADKAIADSLWDSWLDAVAAAPGRKVMLCTTGDIQPTKEQWRKATRVLRDSGKKFAVVTDSRQTSALAKAASWGGVDMQAFHWEQLYEASTFIGLESEQRISMRATITALRDYFGAVNPDGELSSVANRTAYVSMPGPTAPRTPRPERSPIYERPAAPYESSKATVSEPSRTPMADAASRNLEHVRQTSEEIQAKLAEIQARLRNRSRAS